MNDRATVLQLLRAPSVRTLSFAMLIAAFGSGMYLGGSTIFFTRTVGFSPVELTTGLAIASVVGLVMTLPLGSLSDWVGPRRLLISLHVARAIAFVALAFTGDVVMFSIVASIQSICQQASTPILQALIGRATDASTRTTTLALVRSIRNVGFALGALAAAPLIATDALWLNRGVLIGTGAAIAVAGMLLLFVKQATDTLSVRGTSPLAGLRAIRDVRYIGVAGFNGILALHMTMLSVGLPLWVASRSDINSSVAPLILALNTTVVVLAQVPFARGVNNGRSARKALWLGAVALAASCGTLGVAGLLTETPALVVLFVAVLLFTAGEMWHSAGSWEISFLLAPEASRGSYLSVFALGIAAQDAVGPLLFAALILPNRGFGWMGMAVLFLLGAAGATLITRRGEEALLRKAAA